jgi:hypothetical protein
MKANENLASFREEPLSWDLGIAKSEPGKGWGW